MIELKTTSHGSFFRPYNISWLSWLVTTRYTIGGGGAGDPWGSLIPLCLITVLYGLVSRKLWRHNVPGDRLVSSDFDSKRRQETKKIVRTLVVVTAAFAICWLPAQSYNLILVFNFELHDRLPRFVMFVCNWCGHSNSAVNPWLYMLLTKKFRTVLSDMMYKLYLKIYLTLSHPDPNRETCVWVTSKYLPVLCPSQQIQTSLFAPRRQRRFELEKSVIRPQTFHSGELNQCLHD